MTAEVSDIAKQLEEASPLLAASIWTRIAEDRALAIEVHGALAPKARIALAKKLAESQNKHF
jgi:hypothetical protein|tara:strand:- start:732 stop:917 length:186 start_codon:yes stop_codon:yes gene_type:complete